MPEMSMVTLAGIREARHELDLFAVGFELAAHLGTAGNAGEFDRTVIFTGLSRSTP